MKKTLIALAVAASAAVSGSAMAWEANGTGGSVNIGGNLTPAENITPWEVKTGAPVTGLDSDISKGQSVINISVDQAIPVLGIRNFDNNGFNGGENTPLPQISYNNNSVDIDGFSNGVSTLKLDIKDANGSKLGTMVAPFSAGALIGWKPVSNPAATGGALRVLSDTEGFAFYGGLGKTTEAALSSVSETHALISSLDADFLNKFALSSNHENRIEMNEDFHDEKMMFQSVYGAGIESGKVIKITLDTPAQGSDPIEWKASLPVTVSYQ